MFEKTRYAVAATAVSLLTACGGGGGGGGSGPVSPVASALTFNAGSALRTLTANGQSASFNVRASNECVGTGSYTVGPANTSTTFEGQAALSSNSMLNISYTNCSPAIVSSTTTNYVDSNYVPLGATGDRYIVYSGTLNMPTNVRVGDVGIVGTGIRYTNSSKTTQDARMEISYVVEADTANTAFVTVATKAFNNSNTLEATQLTKYRIDASNVMTLVSLTVQYSNGVSVVFTRT